MMVIEIEKTGVSFNTWKKERVYNGEKEFLCNQKRF
jgi:hypothetical protein